jgi:6,7-dimethyl-8-ribityllumazine synthase
LCGFSRIKNNSPQRHRGTEKATKKKSTLKVENPTPAEFPALEGKLDATGRRFAIVVARFNSFITERLLQSACDGLLRSGARRKDISIVRVPGAFEIPSSARTLALTKKYDAIICLGCLLRGDTAHYDVIVNEVTRGIGQSAQETGVPHAFGVLTCENLEQAIDRAGLKMGNKGFEAALAAVEMASLKRAISCQLSAVSPKQIPPFARNDKIESRNDKQEQIPPSRSASRRNDKAMKRASKTSKSSKTLRRK